MNNIETLKKRNAWLVAAVAILGLTVCAQWKMLNSLGKPRFVSESIVNGYRSVRFSCTDTLETDSLTDQRYNELMTMLEQQP